MSITSKIKDKLIKSFTESNDDLRNFVIDIINRDDLIMAIIRGEELDQ